MDKKRVVIALGGNALGKDIEEQKQAVAKTAEVIVDLVQQGMDLIITHGNGPQVGMIQNAMDQLACSCPGRELLFFAPYGMPFNHQLAD